VVPRAAAARVGAPIHRWRMQLRKPFTKALPSGRGLHHEHQPLACAERTTTTASAISRFPNCCQDRGGALIIDLFQRAHGVGGDVLPRPGNPAQHDDAVLVGDE
jgi:hypothetical protein